MKHIFLSLLLLTSFYAVRAMENDNTENDYVVFNQHIPAIIAYNECTSDDGKQTITTTLQRRLGTSYFTAYVTTNINHREHYSFSSPDFIIVERLKHKINRYVQKAVVATLNEKASKK